MVDERKRDVWGRRFKRVAVGGIIASGCVAIGIAGTKLYNNKQDTGAYFGVADVDSETPTSRPTETPEPAETPTSRPTIDDAVEDDVAPITSDTEVEPVEYKSVDYTLQDYASNGKSFDPKKLGLTLLESVPVDVPFDPKPMNHFYDANGDGIPDVVTLARGDTVSRVRLNPAGPVYTDLLEKIRPLVQTAHVMTALPYTQKALETEE